MKINVIGDVHGRTNWKELVKDDAVNVFVGDYFDPYSRIKEDDLVSNFLDITNYKTKHPETVLLYGNHDFHYIVPYYGGSTTRYNHRMSKRFKEIFEEFRDLFYGVAWSPDKTHIVTHAGITKDWVNKYRHMDDFSEKDPGKAPSVSEMEKFINYLWWNSKETEEYPEKSEFSFERNCDLWDTYGTTPSQSPIWIRPESLIMSNMYKETDVVQIVGHTQVTDVADYSERYGVVLVDCLGHVTKSYEFESNMENKL